MKLVINNYYGGMDTEHKALRADPDFIAKVESGFDGKERNYFEFTTTAGERKAFKMLNETNGIDPDDIKEDNEDELNYKI